jgi:hypothetical protein
MSDELGLVVDEAIEGHFYWALSARHAQTGRTVVVEAATGPFPTPKAAIDAGTSALRRHRRERKNAAGPYAEYRASWYADTAPMPLN